MSVRAHFVASLLLLATLLLLLADGGLFFWNAYRPAAATAVATVGVVPEPVASSASTVPTPRTGAHSSILLLFTTYFDLRLLEVSVEQGGNLSYTMDVLLKDLNEASAMDFYYERGLVCWTENTHEAIKCGRTNGTGTVTNKTTVITHGLDKPEGLAIDWYTDKLYWTDGGSNRIEVAQLVTSSSSSVGSTGRQMQQQQLQKVLIWSDLDQPRAIALVPERRYMIWTDWGESPKIERASMDGDPQSRTVLVNDRIFWPNGLAVDLERELIYWVDGNQRFLDVMDLDGSNRRTLVRNLDYPYSLTFTASFLFWTDWKNGTLHYYDLESERHRELLSNTQVPITVHAWDARLQPVAPTAAGNPCRRNNGNCSHLCLLSTSSTGGASSGYSCACPTGIKLLTATQCADGPQDMLFVVQRSQINRISLDSPDYTVVTLPVGKVRYAIAIDYDPVESFIYWSDKEESAIKRAPADGSAPAEEIVTAEIQDPDGLAVDWLARNLYWTDTGTDRIQVCRLDGSFRRVLIYDNLVEPRAIALAPTLGWMFWSDWGEKDPKIERASLDGTERVLIVSQNLFWPNGIALDVATRKIYWCDAKADKIEVANMDGSGRNTILSDNLPHVFGLSLLGDHLYWTDWQRRSIDRAHKLTGTDRATIGENIAELMGLKVARLHEQRGTNPCAVNNGGCSQLCLNRPRDYVCRCQLDYELGRDNRTCFVPPAFLLFSNHGSIGRISIDSHNHTDYAPFRSVIDAHYLDVDVADRRLYWVSQKQKYISRAYINGSDVQRIVETGLMQPEGIAIDWLAHNVYWTDADARRIEVARLDGGSRRILIWKGIEEPKNLILEPRKGLMYWTEWPSDSIRRAAMDGSELMTIISATYHAIGLTLDPDTRRLYWARQSSPTGIESADWDGKRRTRLVMAEAGDSNGFVPAAITIYQDWVYWADWNTGEIGRADKSTGDNRTVVHSNLRYTYSLLAFHPGRQSGSNQCRTNNGGCTHLCLALGQRKMTCACPTHYTLNANRVSCSPPRNYIIFSQRNSFGRFVPNTVDSPDIPLPVTGKNIRAVEYDVLTRHIYWIDGRGPVIRRAFDNGTNAKVSINPTSSPFDMAIDPIGRLLFWSCSHTNTINITTLDGNIVSIGNVDIGRTEKPRSLALHPMKRLLFWTDVGTAQSITRAKLDGSQRVELITKLEGIQALALDPQLNRLFYAHGKRIDTMDINGQDVRTLVAEHISMVSSIAALDGFIYWLDERPVMERISVVGDNRRVEIHKNPHMTDIVAVWTPEERTLRNHTCNTARAECSHICIEAPDDLPSEHVCACPQGLMLLKDRRSCGEQPICGPDHFTCAAPNELSDRDGNKECIPSSWRCDGQKDCPDRSDEMNCPTCRGDQFKCQSGECIEKHLVCDGTTQCLDGYDEAVCCKHPEDFQCPTSKVCISFHNVCDGDEHCARGEDEAPEICSEYSNRRMAPSSSKITLLIVVVVAVAVVFVVVYLLQTCRTRFGAGGAGGMEPKECDQAAAPLSPGGALNKNIRVSKLASVAEAVRMSTLNSRASNAVSSSYDRNHITGASSSTTNGSSLIGYPLNPPPSPATTAGSAGRYCSNYHPYKHYRIINQPPPPTPCSTDACDESDSNYTSKSNRSQRGGGHGSGTGGGTSSSLGSGSGRHAHTAGASGGGVGGGSGGAGGATGKYKDRCYDPEPYPPPPTPHYHSDIGGMLPESCPPSPSSRSSTYFSPLPPPPSPVPSPSRGFS
ncbi:low-density lipoprotein receptor-related protein 6 [Anopheles cruzii]|uniref:low-density lipoprotein receptor-related protein 6 n=1 Tax=Anopheles cruzii TaxID=68878 RepID=UPI0022EC84F3|nr:low-density lipoprotein receptor-related protein 6 [Anopheles cruzii]